MQFFVELCVERILVFFFVPAGGEPTWRLDTLIDHMANRDGELRTRRRNSNSFPRTGQIAI